MIINDAAPSVKDNNIAEGPSDSKSQRNRISNANSTKDYPNKSSMYITITSRSLFIDHEADS